MPVMAKECLNATLTISLIVISRYFFILLFWFYEQYAPVQKVYTFCYLQRLCCNYFQGRGNGSGFLQFYSCFKDPPWNFL